eukprot:TRINITY_DN5817_c0_g1_i1.p1 TRINITY_DN5817_c0_g1~~TRINITY_DN5817_c0_g1_i1.p1  ORF type:complete len:1542 (-),score=471.24 TRINITY_DN5817_c0_g1_i1:80-4384(-)
MDVRRTGRALTHDLARIVRMIELSGICTANQALLVLRCCGDVLVDIDRESRIKLAETYANVLKKNGVEFDVSHYNALLRVHLENQNPVAASDFLAEMEAAGIDPNRVTFQHLVGVYCTEGNIAGATTILEHMKAQDMAINEAVFISLLKGHCLNNDSDSVTATLEVMSASGLSMGADTITAMAYSYGRAGNWAKVEEVLAKAVAEDVSLDDGDMFSIILACSQAGLHKEAQGLVSKLPRKRGYFQELRNHLPQLALCGNVETAVDIYLTMEDKEGGGRDQMGLFVINPIARSGVSLEAMLAAARRMEEVGYSTAIQFLIQEAVQSWPEEKCKELVELVKKEKGVEALEWNRDFLFRSLRGNLQIERNPEKTMASLNNLHAIGADIPWAFIQSDLLQAMINLDSENPGQTARTLKDSCPFITWNMTCSLLLASLFNAEGYDEFAAATGFLLNVNVGVPLQGRWNQSLARAYLKTDSLEDLITILYITSRKSTLGTREPEKMANQLFRVLEHIMTLGRKFTGGSDPEEKLGPVLEELVRLHIGVPTEVVDSLRRLVKSEENLELLDKAVVEWENRENFWTQDAEADCLGERKQLYKERVGDVGGNKAPRQNEYRSRYFAIPESREKMEEIQTILASRGDVNVVLSSKLIQAYAEEGMVDKALDLANYSRKNMEFNVSPSNLEAIVTEMVEQGNAKDAMQVLEDEIARDGKIFISTFMTVLAGMAEAGEDQFVLDNIGKVELNKYLFTKGKDNSNSERLLAVYARKGDVKKVEEVFNTLLAAGLAGTGHVSNLNSLVDVHLVNGDIRAAIAEFERLARLYKKMPKKFELVCRLIDEENVEAMQAVLDISIDLLGEERSLYNLAYCFLHMERRAQAKKLFETPGLRYEKDQMEYMCSQFVESGNLQGLEDLVSLSKGIFGCDRDMLYQQLVSAYKDDADKVEDIWLQVQEEGHAPSDRLKLDIAKALKAGGKSVPFAEPVEYVEVLKSPEVETKEPKVVKKEAKAPREPMNYDHFVDEEVYTALKAEDFNTAVEMVMNSFEKENTSLKCKRKVVEVLIEENKIEEAALLATRLANSFKNPKKIMFRESFEAIADKLDDVKKEEFLSGLNPALRERLWEKTREPSSNTEPAQVKKLKGDNVVKYAGDNAVKEALAKNDITGLIEGITRLQVSIKCRNEILEQMIDENKLDDAAKVALTPLTPKENKLSGPTISILCNLMKKWEESGEVRKTVEFVKNINSDSKFASALRGDIWVKSGLARTDPSGYIDLIKSEVENPNTNKWMLSSDHLVEAVEKQPELLSRLESLAADSFTPAHILLAKLSVAQGNAENLEKHSKLCPTDVLKFRHGVFDKVGTIEKMEMCLEVLKKNGAESEVFQQVANTCLAMNLDSDNLEQIANKALDSGVELGQFNTKALKKLADNKNFRLHSEAQKLLSQSSS